MRANDDGEPTGTAGKLRLNQLFSFQLQNISQFVIRCNGGTKLGVAGLIEAYKEAANLCLNQAEIFEMEEEKEMELFLDPEKYYEVIKLLKYNNINIVDSSYNEDKYVLKISIPTSQMEWLEKII